MVALSKFAMVVVVLLNCGLFLAGAVLTKPLWAKEKPLYVGDFGPRLVSSNGDFVLPNHSRVQWTIRSYRSIGADSSPSQPLDFGVSSFRSSEPLKNATGVRRLSRGHLDRNGNHGSAGAKSSSGDGRFHFPLNYSKIEVAPSNSH